MSGTDFLLLSPQIALALLAIVLVGVDLGLPADRRRLVGPIGALGLLVPAGLQIAVAGNRQTAFFETVGLDPLATYINLTLISAAALVILLSNEFVVRRSRSAGEFHALVVFATLGMTIMASGRELLTLYIGLETASISLYILASFLKDDGDSAEAGIKYVLLGAMASAILLYGIALMYGATGTTFLVGMSTGRAPSAVTVLATVMLVAGFGFKLAAVPFHMWAPDVYRGANAPAVAFIASSSKLAAFAIVFRVFVTGVTDLAEVWAKLFAVLAILTMTIGNLGALRQTNIKRMLGYSSIAQAGYALMALAAPAKDAFAGMLFFLVAYVVTTIAVFAVVTRVSSGLGGDGIDRCDGLAKRSPVLALAMLLAMMSLIGLPLVGGFWGKVYLFLGVFAQGPGGVTLVMVALANSVVAAFYYLRIVYAMYLRPASDEAVVEVDGALGVSLGFATAAMLVMGFLPAPFLAAATAAAVSVTVVLP